jgi:hypothetical protein
MKNGEPMRKTLSTIAAAAVCFAVAGAAASEPVVVTTGFHLLPWRQSMADRLEQQRHEIQTLRYQLLADRQQPISQRQEIYLYLVSPPLGQASPQQPPQTIPQIQIFGQPPQTLPIQGEPRQVLPVPGAPKQPLPIQGEPKQQLPIQGVPPQTLPIEGAPKQELPGGAPKQQLSPQPQALPSAPSPSGYQRYTRRTIIIRALHQPMN